MSDDVVRDLRVAIPELRPSERRVAEIVLNDPTAAVDLTITELAERSGSSVASIVRLCRNLGHSGYSDFRLALASAVGRSQVSLQRFSVTDGDISEADDARTVVAKLAFHEARAIEETAKELDLEALDKVARAVVGASRIDMFGAASSGLTALDLQQKLHRLGLVSHSWSDVHLALTSAVLLNDECVAIGFSHSGRTIETNEYLEAAQYRGAFTALVTNYPGAPLARHADAVLVTSTTETRYRPGAIAGRIAQLAVVDFLFVRIAQLLSTRTFDPLERTYEAVQPHRISSRPRKGSR